MKHLKLYLKKAIESNNYCIGELLTDRDMFFDEELEVIFGEHLDDETPKGFVDDLMKCWKRRMPQPNVGVQTFINEVRKMDYSWQLFCKKYKGFKIDAFRTFVLNCADDELKEKFKKAFHW